MDRAVKIVRAIFPGAKAEYVAAFEAGDAKLAAAGITTPLRLAHLLAQCGAESGGLKVTRESLMYTTEARLQQIFNNMSLSKPLMQGEVENAVAPGEGPWRTLLRHRSAERYFYEGKA